MNRYKLWLADTIFILGGSSIFGIGLQCFTLPNQILLGGATGIGTVLFHFFTLPVGLTVLLFNLPLFFICWRMLGGRFILRTAYATVLFSITVDVIGWLWPFTYTNDRLLAALFGGLLMGGGLSLIYARGMMTGGTDLLAILVQRVLPSVSFGRLILLIDTAIVVCGALVFRSVEVALYSALLTLVYSLVLENYLSGRARGKVALIFTEDETAAQQLQTQLQAELQRGTTRLSGQGGYSGVTRPILVLALGESEMPILTDIIKRQQHKTFILILQATNVWGEGFSTPEGDMLA